MASYIAIFQLVVLTLAIRCVTQNHYMGICDSKQAAIISRRPRVDNAIGRLAMEESLVGKWRTKMYDVWCRDKQALLKR